MRQAILGSIVLLSVLASISCRPRSSASPGAATAPARTHRTHDGLQVTPVEVERNELAAVLGVTWWRFHFVPPSRNQAIHYTIELRKKGESPRVIANSGMWAANMEEGQMVVALWPVDGQINTADRLKTYVRIAGSVASSLVENPLKGFSGLSSSPAPAMQADESLTLMELSQHPGTYPDPNNALLVLTLRVGEPASASRQ